VRSYLERRQAGPQASNAPSPGGSERLRQTWSLLYSVLGLWWLLAIAYLAGLYMVWAGGQQEGFFHLLRPGLLTALIIAASAAAAVLVRGLVGRSGNWASRSLACYPGLQARVPMYARGLSLVLQTSIVVLAICFALEAWGLAALAALESTTGKNLISAAVGIVLTILLAMAAIDVVTVFTERFLELREREGKATGKVKTLVPLVRAAIKVVVAVVACLMILSEIGVQVAPLLAGVGILGLAVGFGAQTLVKDLITGFFILLEDSVGVGDVASVNGTGGLVEAINLRSIRLRDDSGNVHTIPFSSVQTVTNMTKGFSKYLVEAAVAYREDVDEVVKVLKEVGDDLQKDPEFGKDILEPIEILGLDRFEDSAVIVRARLTTKPIQQWRRVGREFNRRMKRAFDARGIEIPFPHRTIYLGELKDGRAPPLRIRSEDGEDGSTSWKGEPKTTRRPAPIPEPGEEVR
jgi:small conductance mechanosensitive channel